MHDASALLPQDARARLAKLLGMLGSDHAGERDAAALAAHRLVTQPGLTWRQVMTPPAVEKPLPELGTWRATVRRLQAFPHLLRPWERSFLADLPGSRRLSVKQRYVLKEIADRVLPQDGGGA
jgi:hypothetical protein